MWSNTGNLWDMVSVRINGHNAMELSVPGQNELVKTTSVFPIIPGIGVAVVVDTRAMPEYDYVLSRSINDNTIRVEIAMSKSGNIPVQTTDVSVSNPVKLRIRFTE